MTKSAVQMLLELDRFGAMITSLESLFANGVVLDCVTKLSKETSSF